MKPSLDDASVPTPPIRTVQCRHVRLWLQRGWSDMRRCAPLSLLHGLVFVLAGWGVAGVAAQRFWLLAGALSGFLIVAPLLATGLYAASRALERGEPVRLDLVRRIWGSWRKASPEDPSSAWALVRFGLLLSLAGTGWVLTSAALITLLAPMPIRTPMDFLQHVVAAPDSHLFALWLGLGAVMAAPIFASSVVTLPLLLDRRIGMWPAVRVSWHAVVANPQVMALWAFAIMALTLVAMVPLLLGLVPVVPVLGHASWHAYRDLVDSAGLPQRHWSEERA